MLKFRRALSEHAHLRPMLQGQKKRFLGPKKSDRLSLRSMLPNQQGDEAMKARCAVCGFIGYVRYPRSKAGHYQLTKPDLWICENHKEDWR